jgi:predicted methyltransferase
MQNVRLTQLAQELCRQVLRPGDTAVDATCGNGHDTAFLAAAVGSSGTVHAFDIQQTALDQTRAAVGAGTSSLPALHFHLASHADMLQHVDTSCARVVMFNLGYLPGSDKGTTTQVDSTLAAVQAACEVLQAGGLCSVLCYTGHSGGSIGRWFGVFFLNCIFNS